MGTELTAETSLGSQASLSAQFVGPSHCVSFVYVVYCPSKYIVRFSSVCIVSLVTAHDTNLAFFCT
jgi:hypothetical protein